MAVDEQEAFEPVLHQRRHHIADHRDQRRRPQRHRAGESQMVLRHADGQRRRHQAADRIADAPGDKLRVQMVGADQPVRSVLLGGTDRDDDAARGSQILLDLMPGGQRELHDPVSSSDSILPARRPSRNNVATPVAPPVIARSVATKQSPANGRMDRASIRDPINPTSLLPQEPQQRRVEQRRVLQEGEVAHRRQDQLAGGGDRRRHMIGVLAFDRLIVIGVHDPRRYRDVSLRQTPQQRRQRLAGDVLAQSCGPVDQVVTAQVPPPACPGTKKGSTPRTPRATESHRGKIWRFARSALVSSRWLSVHSRCSRCEPLPSSQPLDTPACPELVTRTASQGEIRLCDRCEMPEGGNHDFGLTVFHVDAGGGGPDAGFQWPDFLSASATSFGI